MVSPFSTAYCAMLTPFHVVKTLYSETEISRDRTIETPNFPMNSLMLTLAFPAWCEHPHGRIAINSQSFFSRNFFLRADFHCFLLSISFFNLESFMLLSPYLVMEQDCSFSKSASIHFSNKSA